MMGIWVPETCWAVPKNNKVFKWHLVVFFFPTYVHIISQTTWFPGKIKDECFNFLYNFTKTFLILRNLERDNIKKALRSSYEVLYDRFQSKLNFLGRFSKNDQYQISWKSVQWEQRCSMRTEEQTHRTELSVALSSFGNVSKNCCLALEAPGIYVTRWC
jgi:hypothetical protein